MPEDYTEAAHWYRKAAELGLAEAQSNFGALYTRGLGVPRNSTEAATWFRKSAEQGYATAQYNLGVLFGSGLGVPQDYKEAPNWFRKLLNRNWLMLSPIWASSSPTG